MLVVGTFRIQACDNGFVVFDNDRFNDWGSVFGFTSSEEAKNWATYAHSFKTGRTFKSYPEWLSGFHA